jgi:2-polyprenyl-3-methyl-5-hydroxy-6-metoxy-1,4-benzoquinol methylase
MDGVTGPERDRAAARSAFFDKLAGNWSQAHYGPRGAMVARIARFAGALENLVPPGAEILDYGCGSGDIAAALAARGYRVEGRDMSPNMIAQARAIHADSGVRFAVTESVGADADVEPGDGTFDAIVCSSVLEYVNDVPGSLRSLVGAVKPGGWLLATVPNGGHPVRRGEAWHRRLMSNRFARAVIRLTPKRESFELQWLSHNRFPVSEWAGLFRAAGLHPVWQDCEDHPLTLLIGRRRSTSNDMMFTGQ